MAGASLELVIVLDDGERIERTRTFRDANEANSALSELIDEQVADGFLESTTPAWGSFLDGLVAHWREDDPTFDVDSLRSSLIANESPSAREMVEQVMALSDPWVAQADGSSVLDFDRSEADAAEGFLLRHLPATLPALVLALRHPDHGAQMRVDSMLSHARLTSALPGLLSVVEHPAPNLTGPLGGRSQWFPAEALSRLGVPSDDTADSLIRLLDHPDFRISDASARVLAEHATTDPLFEALYRHRARAKVQDGYAWCLLRAAEVRRDPVLRPHLEWMLRSRRFASSGYPERIREALAALR